MKTLFSFTSVALLSWSCGTIDPDATIGFRGGQTPLDRMTLSPASNATDTLTGDSSGTFQAGDYVEVSSPDTPFYSVYPKSQKAASTPMQPGTMLIVLGLDSKYMHVQTEEGTHGYLANTTVVPQGLLVGDTSLNADEMEVVEWSEIAETTQKDTEAE